MVHIVPHNLRNMDELFSSFAAVVIDEFDDECIDDNDDMLFFGYKAKPSTGTGCNCELHSNECNSDDDDDDDTADGNIVSTDDSSSVSGSERVR